MKFLFLKRALSFPRVSGHDVHTFEMMRALETLGHRIGFATVIEPMQGSLDGLTLEAGSHSFAGEAIGSVLASHSLNYLQRRFLRYWGIDGWWLNATASLVAAMRPDAVVAAGLEMLPCLAAVRGPTRIWYAADEYALHHLSQLKFRHVRTWRHLGEAAVAAIYERAFAPRYDRAWMVSRREAQAMTMVGGARFADVVPNGVDADYYHPGDEPTVPESCVFWGRLDAEPNIEAVRWFARRVWPGLRREFPGARLGLFGVAPVPAVLGLQGDGIEVTAGLPDLRSAVRGYGIAVMPFVSGGGIKNKLLEAAAMAMPIVASPRGCIGLDTRGGLPLVVARRPDEWFRAIARLWREPARRAALGARSRAWVMQRHSWGAAARAVVACLRGRECGAATP